MKKKELISVITFCFIVILISNFIYAANITLPSPPSSPSTNNTNSTYSQNWTAQNYTSSEQSAQNYDSENPEFAGISTRTKIAIVVILVLVIAASIAIYFIIKNKKQA